jgi:hypothetical protein
MPPLEIKQALAPPGTQNVLSLPVAAPIFCAVSREETLMEIVDRVCDPFFCGALKSSTVATTSRRRIGDSLASR